MSNVHRVEQLFRAIKEEFGWAVPTSTSVASDNAQSFQRWGHSLAVESNHSAWIFGGYGNTDGRVHRHADVHHATINTGEHEISINQVPISTDIAPSARMFASACYVNGSILLFGGRHSPEVALHDLWRFDTAERSFNECKCEGNDATQQRQGPNKNDNDKQAEEMRRCKQ